MSAAGDSGSVTVTTQPECAWNATSGAPWITGLTPTSGQGNGEVTFQVAANPTATARQGDLILNDIRAHLTQSGVACHIDLSPANLSVAAEGGSGTIAVTSPAGCAWTVSTDASWIRVTSGASGTGNGSIGYSVAANSGATRSGAITIGDQPFGVTQAAVGTPACQYTIQPPALSIAAAGGTTTVTVTTQSGCAWTASTAVPWLSVTSGASGTGNGPVGVSVAANTGASRNGTITIAGQSFVVTQAAASAPACQYTLQSTGASIGAGGGSVPVSVQTGASCAWTAASNAAWLTVAGGASGNGTATITVASNTGNARTGTLTIAGQTFTLTQAGLCAVSINPAAQTVAAGGGTAASVAVTANTSCSWTSAASAGWITITGGASGTGNGTVAFTAAANTGPLRTATITIGGQVHTVTQNSGCVYTINPTSRSIGKGLLTDQTVTVTTTASCTWTAATNTSWLSISAGASGTGSGAVTYSVERNDSGIARVGTLTIAGLTFTVNQGR